METDKWKREDDEKRKKCEKGTRRNVMRVEGDNVEENKEKKGGDGERKKKKSWWR